ncbi:MAG: hypothetical protein JSC189_001235 [Candidatus Tokpelaia sp. JSC189]|nr:MAG: hypothetical protein JSC189_001235 [Candidatus Tokpelaia sp. JSC189]
MAKPILFVVRSAAGFLSAVFLFASFDCIAQAQQKIQKHITTVAPSGLPLPRFVSLKSNRINARVGPDQNKYAIAWTYRRQGLPVEIVQEYDNWRRIRDSDGEQGWVNQALLSGRRTAIITPWQKDKKQLQDMHKQPSANSALAARVEPGVIGNIRQCNGEWCELAIGKNRGWLKQNKLWGVYLGEKINSTNW